MILPTKRISAYRCLMGIGADILRLLKEPMTVSRLWAEHQKLSRARSESVESYSPITYDWFVLSLDLLFMIGAIQIEQGRIRKQTSK